MIKGYTVVVIKDRSGRRMVEESIGEALAGWRLHYPKAKTEDLVALVSPRLYDECELAGCDYGIAVEGNRTVPYPQLWVCEKGEEGIVRS